MRSLRNQRGQVAVEYMLIIVLLLAVSAFVTQEIKKNQVMGQLVEKPWATLANVIENGVIVGSKADHPNMLGRHLSFKGKAVHE